MDDTNIHFSHCNPYIVEQTVNRDLDDAAIWFRENGMRANPERYQAIVLGNTGSQDVTIKCGTTEIPTTDEIELLGVTLDRNLKFYEHISTICRKVSSQINALRRLKNILPLKTKETTYQSFDITVFVLL